MKSVMGRAAARAHDVADVQYAGDTESGQRRQFVSFGAGQRLRAFRIQVQPDQAG